MSIDQAILQAIEKEHHLKVEQLLSDTGHTREVYLATLLSPQSTSLGKRVVKFEKPFAGRSSVTTALNQIRGSPNVRELERICTLKHPSIIRIENYFVLKDTVVNIEEHFPSETLQQRIQREPLSEYEFEQIFLQAIEGLAYAEEQGIYHRDIKPDNLLINDRRDIKWVDFANAGFVGTMCQKVCPTRGATVTSYPLLLEGLLEGKEVRTSGVTERYSLAATMFYALTGEYPVRYSLKVNPNGKPIHLDETTTLSDNQGEILVTLEGETVEEGKVNIKKHNELIRERVKQLPVRAAYQEMIRHSLAINEHFDLTDTGEEFRDLKREFESMQKIAIELRREKRSKRLAWLTGGLIVSGLILALYNATFNIVIDSNYRAHRGATESRYTPEWIQPRIRSALNEERYLYEPSFPDGTALDNDLVSALMESYDRFDGASEYGFREHIINGLSASTTGPDPKVALVKRLNFNLNQFDTYEDAVLATIVGHEQFYYYRAVSDSNQYESMTPHISANILILVEFTMARYQRVHREFEYRFPRAATPLDKESLQNNTNSSAQH